MTEFFFALGVLVVSALGLAMGVLFGRSPVTTSCAGATRYSHLRCADCPLNRARAGEEAA